MSLSYDFQGKRHDIMDDEIDAIERSGKCNTDRYRFDETVNEPEPFIMEKVIAMHSRPGKISDGLRPPMRLYQGYVPSLASGVKPKPLSEMIIPTIHWSDRNGKRGRCGAPYGNAQTYSKSIFRKFMHSERVCALCASEYRRENY